MSTAGFRRGFTLVDLLIVLALGVIVLSVALPQARVDRIVAAEDDAIGVLADLDLRLGAHRAAAATDVDGDGRGEYARLGSILGERAEEFTRVEGTDTWERAGFYYTVLLPGPDKRPVRADSAEVMPDYAEVAYLVVAWPTKPGSTGMRAYVRRPDGLLQHTIDGYPYDGADGPPFPPAPMVVGGREDPRPNQRGELEEWAVPIFETR